MERFGSDKPDLRFGLELVELTPLFAETGFNAFKAPARQGHPVPGGAAEHGRNKLDALTDRAKQLGAKGLVWMKVEADGVLDVAGGQVPVRRREGRARRRPSRAEAGDLLLIVADERPPACEVLGTLRNDLGRPPVHEGPYRYLWVVDFPMFAGVDDAGQPQARPPPLHHAPPRRPRPARDRPACPCARWPTTWSSTAGSWARASCGSTSRSSSPHLPLLGISEDEAQARFGFLLDAVPLRRAARTAASPSASTGWWRSSPARRTSARSSPSPRRSRASTR